MNADSELINDIMDTFHELYDQIDYELSQLAKTADQERLNSIFRDVHTIKGNAAMVHKMELVEYTHSLEEVAESLRSNRFAPNEALCEAIQVGMDRLRDMHYRDMRGHNFPNLNDEKLKSLYIAVANSEPAALDSNIKALTIELGLGTDIEDDQNINEDSESSSMDTKVSISGSKKIIVDESCFRDFKFNQMPLITEKSADKRMEDLSYFQELSFQVDRQNPFWIDRSIKMYDWSLKINQLAGSPIDYQQLAAAVYMHDFGMILLQQKLVQKNNRLSDEEKDEMRRHVNWGYDFMIRIPGWEEAALIILSHHERVDGTGYPNKLAGKLIHPGAKILAIMDAFFSMVNGRADRTQRRSAVRAISEINAASGSQFDKCWVEIFNEVIKKEAKQGLI